MPHTKSVSRLSNQRSKSKQHQRSSSKNSIVSTTIPSKYKGVDNKLKKAKAEKNGIIAKYNDLVIQQAVPD